ncbi:hypothetical protein GCM10010502_74080 [Kitasatospora aureofaciens]|uniref:Uncharacterized protein n=1 Tax=Kitasatospora aureofaciens TaxID=1894 RepID=A0A8H9I0U0_KITAU|nr:hypothetical protein GCM10010502_74080 [Kitasatospora aureofaciens]
MPFGATATASGLVPAGIVTVENAALNSGATGPRTAGTWDPPAGTTGRTPQTIAGAPDQPVFGSMANLSGLRGPPKKSHRGPRRTAPVYANRITACTPGQREGPAYAYHAHRGCLYPRRDGQPTGKTVTTINPK